MDQPTGDFEPPAHPAGIGLHEIVGTLRQPDHVNQMRCAFASYAPGQIVVAAIEVNIFPTGEIDVGGQRLRNYSNRLAHAHRLRERRRDRRREPWPEVGTINVVSIRLSVVLPAPLGPSRPNNSPRLTSKLTWSTAVKVPKRLVRSRACIAADGDSIVDCECDLGGHPRLDLAGGLQNPDLDVKRANVLATAPNVGLGRELTLLPDRHHLPREHQGRTGRQRHLRGTANPDRAQVGLLQIDSRPYRRRSSTVRIGVPGVTHSPTSRFLLTTVPEIGARITVSFAWSV